MQFFEKFCNSDAAMLYTLTCDRKGEYLTTNYMDPTAKAAAREGINRTATAEKAAIDRKASADKAAIDAKSTADKHSIDAKASSDRSAFDRS